MLSSFTVKPYHSNRLSSYSKRMSTPRGRDKNIVDKIMVSILKQQGYSWPENTSSEYDPQALYDSLARYSPNNDVFIDVTTSSWKRAIAATFKIFAKSSYHPYLNPLYTADEMWSAIKPSKSSGLPMMEKKGDDFWYAMNREQQIREGLKVPSPCIANARTQLGGKTRLVWGYPLEMTLLESRFASRLIERYMEMITPMAAGISKFELGGRISSIEGAYGQTYGLDFSKFDSTVPRKLIEIVFSILATWYTEEDRKNLGWDAIVRYFIYTPIVMPNQKLYRGKKFGIPSGSYFTQLVGSITNCLIQFWLAEECGYSLNNEKFLVLGDDVILSIPKEVPLDSLKSKLEMIGMIMNPDKTRTDSHFLGAVWIRGIPYRETTELLQKMVYPENYRKYPSQNTVDRLWLGYQLIMQYSAAYANATQFLMNFFGTGNVDVVDQAPIGVRAMTKSVWEEYQVSALEFIARDPNRVRHSLGARLMA